jgi:hypothetical protein
MCQFCEFDIRQIAAAVAEERAATILAMTAKALVDPKAFDREKYQHLEEWIIAEGGFTVLEIKDALPWVTHAMAALYEAGLITPHQGRKKL